MVECELYLIYLHTTSTNFSFNRYMVECECYSLPLMALTFLVLIDTWWNVNVSAAGQAGEWEDSFNRYMVECEYCILDVVNSYFEVLIDTWWNVNTVVSSFIAMKL